MLLRGVKIRLYPTPEQEKEFWGKINAARFLYNWGLGLQMEKFANKEKLLTGNQLRDLIRHKAKTEDDFRWLEGMGMSLLSIPLFDLDEAFGRFFEHLKSDRSRFSEKKLKKLARKGKTPTVYDMQHHPKFKKKGEAKLSFPARQDRTTFKEKKGILLVTLEGLGKVEFKTDLDWSKWGTIYNPRVKRINNKWILTFAVEQEPLDVEFNDFCLGVDVGVKDLAIINTPTETKVFKNINKTKAMKKREKRQKRLDRAVSRKQEGSKNREKAKKVAAESKRKIKNIRNTYTHQVSREIVNYLPKAIGIEDLNISGMMKNRNLAKAIQDTSLAMLIKQIEYKSESQGTRVIKADRWFPSSKKCSCCGNIKKGLKLRDRVYVCEVCGLVIDRDENAAINLRLLAESA